MENNIDRPAGSQGEPSTREKILISAARLFAQKGFTETTIRELAKAVELNPATLYYYFSSKQAILDCLLDDYEAQVRGKAHDPEMLSCLRDNPTADGILRFVLVSFPEDKKGHYLNVLRVQLQEQHRNSTIRTHVVNSFKDIESQILAVVDILKELKVIRQDTDPDFWMKAASSLHYAFSSRLMLGIGDGSPNYSGRSLADLLRDLFDTMLRASCVQNDEAVIR